MKLSVVMPCYNERETILTVIDLVREALPGVSKELVIVDDGSKDGTRDILSSRFPTISDDDIPAQEADGGIVPNEEMAIKVVFHKQNLGKGGALGTGLKFVTGDVVVIQDADLEYDPRDWADMYDLIAVRNTADVVYGSRFYGKPHRSLNFHHYVANRLISRLFSMLYNQTLNDIEVCYKMFSRPVLQSLALTQRDFGVEVQISAQIAKGSWRVYETAIRYYGRTYDEGKKINWKDGVKALWYIFKFRFSQ